MNNNIYIPLQYLFLPEACIRTFNSKVYSRKKSLPTDDCWVLRVTVFFCNFFPGLPIILHIIFFSLCKLDFAKLQLVCRLLRLQNFFFPLQNFSFLLANFSFCLQFFHLFGNFSFCLKIFRAPLRLCWNW